MPRKLLTILTATSAFLAMLGGSQAFARTQGAVLGNAYNVADIGCFTMTSVPYGLINTCTSGNRYWDMPVPWDTGTGFAKTITVRAKIKTGGGISCIYEGWNADSTPVGSITFGAFSSGASTITVTNVPGGSFGHVVCSLGGNGTTVLQGLDYTP